MPQIDRTEGRRLFGADPAAYDLARPGHPNRVYAALVERCGVGRTSKVLEIGPGTGQATLRLLELGADVIAVEPDPALAEHLHSRTGGRVEVRMVPLEEAGLPAAAFDLAVAASSFHWVEERAGLAMIFAALRPGGWIALWWTLFGVPGETDEFITATAPLLADLDSSPTAGIEGRPPHALDTEVRVQALGMAGFREAEHEVVRWTASWDTVGIRALYGSFSPIARLDDSRRTEILDGIARIAEEGFGGRVQRTLVTSLYTAHKPP